MLSRSENQLNDLIAYHTENNNMLHVEREEGEWVYSDYLAVFLSLTGRGRVFHMLTATEEHDMDCI